MNFQKSAQAYIQERLNGPYFATLVISWIAWNWKIIVLLFFTSSNELGDHESKIEYIQANCTDLNLLLWFPLISSLVVSVVYPLVSLLAYTIHMGSKKIRAKIKYQLSPVKRLSEEESQILLDKARAVRIEMQQLVKAKNDEIESLHRNINLDAGQQSELRSQIEKLRIQLSEGENVHKELKETQKELLDLGFQRTRVKRMFESLEDEKKFVRAELARRGISIPEYDQPITRIELERLEEEKRPSDRYVTINSPMIGTFYSTDSPDKEPYVSVDTVIKPGTVVCIIEAMKLFNQIESEISGRIVKVLVEDMTPIEFDQPLFLVDPEADVLS